MSMTTDSFRKGDRVYVTDPALAELRRIMTQATGSARPNHHGTVDEVYDDQVVIVFDGEDGPATSNAAPYPVDEVVHLPVDRDPWGGGTS